MLMRVSILCAPRGEAVVRVAVDRFGQERWPERKRSRSSFPITRRNDLSSSACAADVDLCHWRWISRRKLAASSLTLTIAIID
jgi:hypothetical protein